ncbi:hypothetical protein [Bradyrhizobium sp. 195]|uniref:hypothetical protein n=1 Tax=Bradyrhizobium sp. 195 TaxID=2782662 RepID=UPI002001AA15|nr:hypothetical protein [Bradyrhizobium sp. 195]UPK23885.1 hypothetical protein IVB26_21035 [Bradyrhizobium sp. 195]
MFNKKTVFILGAGSSAEFGMPTGEKLKSEIAALLAPGQGEEPIRFKEVLRRQNKNWPELMAAGSHVAAALPSFLSIDEALHYLSDDPNAVFVGKHAIAYSLLRHEAASKVGFDHNGRVNPSRWGNTWLSEFLSVALSFARRQEADELFSNVTVINFNYDRVLEQYLVHALQHVGRLTKGRAETLTERLKVVRPYGSLGRLPWQAHQARDLPLIEFGLDNIDNSNLAAVSAGLMTYTEQAHEPEKMQEISNAMHTAEVIIAIGFGFHQQNMTLLKSAVDIGNRTTMVTAAGIDKENHSILVDQLREFFRCGRVGVFDKRGYEFMSHLRPIISAAVS